MESTFFARIRNSIFRKGHEQVTAAEIIKPCGWIVTLPGCKKAHHVYLSFPRDAQGNPIKTQPRPVLSVKERVDADLVSTCLWHPIESQLYLYSSCVDIDILGTSADNLDGLGRISEQRLKAVLSNNLPNTAPLFKLVRSTSGRGIHLWLFFPAFPLNSGNPRYERQEAMVTKILLALKRLLTSHGFGADFQAAGLHHLYANWRNPRLAIDRDIPFLQARIRRSHDPEHKVYSRILSLVYYELRDRDDMRDIFHRELRKLYRDQRIADKLLAFTLANHAALQRGDLLRFRCSELLRVLGVSKNSLPKLVAEVTADAPTLGIRIERDLQAPGYYFIGRGKRFDAIKPPEAARTVSRKGLKTNSIDVIEPLKRPEQVGDGERNYEVCKAALKLKLSGVEKSEASRIVSIYARRAIQDHDSMTLLRINEYVDNIYTNHPDNKGAIPGLAPKWLLSIKTSSYPKSLKGELKCADPGQTPQPASTPRPPVRPSEGHEVRPQRGGRRRATLGEKRSRKPLRRAASTLALVTSSPEVAADQAQSPTSGT